MGNTIWEIVKITIVETHITTTSQGGILNDDFSTASKYLIKPAEE